MIKVDIEKELQTGVQRNNYYVIDLLIWCYSFVFHVWVKDALLDLLEFIKRNLDQVVLKGELEYLVILTGCFLKPILSSFSSFKPF